MSGQIKIFLGVLFSATQYMILLITLAISTPPSLSPPLSQGTEGHERQEEGQVYAGPYVKTTPPRDHKKSPPGAKKGPFLCSLCVECV